MEEKSANGLTKVDEMRRELADLEARCEVIRNYLRGFEDAQKMFSQGSAPKNGKAEKQVSPSSSNSEMASTIAQLRPGRFKDSLAIINASGPKHIDELLDLLGLEKSQPNKRNLSSQFSMNAQKERLVKRVGANVFDLIR